MVHFLLGFGAAYADTACPCCALVAVLCFFVLFASRGRVSTVLFPVVYPPGGRVPVARSQEHVPQLLVCSSYTQLL